MLENLIDGLGVTIIGMGVVFLTLLVLSYVLELFRILSTSPKPKTEEAKVEEPPAEEPSDEQEYTDDLELVAVIAAAIAASLETTTDKLQVRSIRKTSSNGSAWSNAGRREQLRNTVY